MKRGCLLGLITICILMGGIAFWWWYPGPALPGNTDHFITEISDSNKLSRAEVEAAVLPVLEQFKAYEGCTLTRIWYDESTAYDLWPSYEDDPNAIVLYGDFTTDANTGDSGFNSNYSYKKWSWLLLRDGLKSPWIIKDCGYC